MGSALSLAESYNESYIDDVTEIDDTSSTDTPASSKDKAGAEQETTILEDIKGCCSVCGCSKRNTAGPGSAHKAKKGWLIFINENDCIVYGLQLRIY